MEHPIGEMKPDEMDSPTTEPTDMELPKPRKYVYKYQESLVMLYYHVAAVYALYLCFYSAKWLTIGFNLVLHIAAVWGVTAGAHRLWSHRTYKAKLPLQILLMLCHSMALQWSVFHWARDHRTHHKYVDTDSDPHNANRGFFYSHIGWLLVNKHPDVIKRGKEEDLSDLYSNPVLQFQNKYYPLLATLLAFVLPTIIPIYFWNETLNNAHHISILRMALSLNCIFTINSVTHMFGFKPYDKNALSTQNIFISIISLGEGYHNYHHTFPWDYRGAEPGNNCFNFNSKSIDFFAKIGWAYDLRTASKNMVEQRSKRSGDGTDLWGRMKST